MPMITSQILKSVDFTKTQKSRYLKNEFFFLQIKIYQLDIKGYLITKTSFVAEVTFKLNPFMTEAVKSMDWFLYDSGLRHERVKYLS